MEDEPKRSFSEAVQSYYAAIEQEFKEAETEEDVIKATSKLFAMKLKEIADGVLQIALYSESEAQRMNASKFAIAFVQSAKAAGDGELADLLKELQEGEAKEKAAKT